MNRERIVCCITSEEFNGTVDEAVLAGWEHDGDGWCSPAPGWARFPRLKRGRISTERVEYEGGIDFDPRPLNFNGA